MTDANPTSSKRKFLVELIKPSHYDDSGYVIQWWRAFVPSNSLSSVYGLSLDVASRNLLGDDVELVISAYDEANTVVPFKKIRNRILDAGGNGLVCLIGVQSNQFPRAMDIARRFRDHDIQVVIGGFHASGCMAMLPDLPPDLKEALDMGVTLFAGEAEGRLAEVYQDALERKLPPIYNYMQDLPGLQNQPTPFLPVEMIQRYGGRNACFDVGRGCPFACSFCTIINVQGRKSRYRDADDVERLIRDHAAQGMVRYFITDDNFARNKNWEANFDRIIELKEQGLPIKFMLQVDTLCHKIPNFIEKAARAGCGRVFIGLETINPDNLKAVTKGQNRITEYRTMLQAWREANVMTYCGYILGFPGDTPESIMRDIEIVKRELPIDLVEFFILTPLPGSADHRNLYTTGVWMDPDMNKYDLEHVTTGHPIMSMEELQEVYHQAWNTFYSEEHIETLMRRAVARGMKSVKFLGLVLWFYGSLLFEKVHPLQGGVFRIKDRSQRRSGLPLESLLIFCPRRVWELVRTYLPVYLYYRKLKRINQRVSEDPASRTYTDLALTPVENAEEEELEMFEVSTAAKSAVAKAKRMHVILEAHR